MKNRDYLRSERGSMSSMLALVLVPLLAAAGTSIDYVRAYQVRSELQAALDAAAMSAALAKASTQGAKIEAGTLAYQKNASEVVATATPSISFAAGKVTASATLNMPTSFLSLVGIKALNIDGTSQVMAGGGGTEVVMVLDYSSSMSGSKFDNMQAAAINFVNKVTDNGTNSAVKVGLVPFANEVYVSLPGEYVLGGAAGTTWTNCTRDRRYPYNISDDPPVAGDDATKWGRVDSDDIISATEYDTCPNYLPTAMQIRPLTTDHAGTIAQLKAGSPYTGTNISLGLEFGWHVISPGEPFAQGAAYGSGTGKFIVLLSDGRQHAKGYGPGGTNSVDNGIANIVTTCEAVRAKGITLMVVAYEMDDPLGKEDLQKCASEGQYFYESDELHIDTVLDDIGGRLIAKDVHFSM